MVVVAEGPVYQDCGVEHLAAANALPCIEGTNEIIIFLTVHAAVAAWTFHRYTLRIVITGVFPMAVTNSASVPNIYKQLHCKGL